MTTLQKATLHHLRNDFYFTYETTMPPEIGERVELTIDGKSVSFYVACIDERREVVWTAGGIVDTVTTYTVHVKAWGAI